MKIGEIEKLVANLHDKSEYAAIHIRNLKQDLNHGLVIKKIRKVVNFDGHAWLKEYEHRPKKISKR